MASKTFVARQLVCIASQVIRKHCSRCVEWQKMCSFSLICHTSTRLARILLVYGRECSSHEYITARSIPFSETGSNSTSLCKVKIDLLRSTTNHEVHRRHLCRHGYRRHGRPARDTGSLLLKSVRRRRDTMHWRHGKQIQKRERNDCALLVAALCMLMCMVKTSGSNLQGKSSPYFYIYGYCGFD